jgi:ribosome-associated translation inhibitor RaiA
MAGIYVQMAADIALPSMIRTRLVEQTTKTLERQAGRFGFVQVNMHLKHEGPKVGCHMHVVTDDGRYYANTSEWDVRVALENALDNVALQMAKHLDKRLAHA